MVPKIPALAAVFLVSDGVHPAPSTPLVGHGQGARSAAARACGLWDAAARLRAASLAAETRSSRAVGSSPSHGSLGWAVWLKPHGPRKVRAAPAIRPTPHPHTPPRAHSARPARLRRPRARPAPRAPPSAALARSPALARRCEPSTVARAADGCAARRGAPASTCGLPPGPAVSGRASPGALGLWAAPGPRPRATSARPWAWAWPAVASGGRAPPRARRRHRPWRLRPPAHGPYAARPAPAPAHTGHSRRPPPSSHAAALVHPQAASRSRRRRRAVADKRRSRAGAVSGRPAGLPVALEPRAWPPGSGRRGGGVCARVGTFGVPPGLLCTQK